MEERRGEMIHRDFPGSKGRRQPRSMVWSNVKSCIDAHVAEDSSTKSPMQCSKQTVNRSKQKEYISQIYRPVVITQNVVPCENIFQKIVL